MRHLLKSTLLLSVISCLATQAVLADQGQFYLAPGLQWMNFDNGTQFDNDYGFFIGLGFDITDRTSIELSSFELEPENSAGQDIDVDHWKVDLLYDLDWRLGQFDTFVVAGVGNTEYQHDNDTVWDIGAGVNYEINDKLSWRTAIRTFSFLGRDHEDMDFGIDTALVYRFGGTTRSRSAVRPSAAAEPSPAPVVGDADGDGVADDRDNCPDTPRNYAVDAEGCPIPVEEIARIELLVNFDFDRSEVRAEYFSEIEQVASFMRQYPDVVVELEGHTDSVGTVEYNEGLSLRRASAVRAVMIDRFNVQGGRITTSGFGESQPVASNSTDAGRAQNRRVITVIIKTLQNYQPR